MIEEIEADGFITPPSALEKINENRAKPISECIYPACEECDKYHGHYCTVPMVVSKQNYIEINNKIDGLMERILYLENLVYDEILGTKPQTSGETETNLTWADYFREEEK